MGPVPLGIAFLVGILTGLTLKPPIYRASAALPIDRLQASVTSSWDSGALAGTGTHRADLLRVQDGDTFEARVEIWPGLQMVTGVRLRGIDAAEIKSRCAEEHRLAHAAREGLQRLLAEGAIRIRQIGVDKDPGRVLATVSTRSTPDVSEALRKAGLARGDDGVRRAGWCEGSVR
jgi:endonuclease YncB( thermonuclease family)